MAARLLESIDDMKQVIMDSARFLLTPDKAQYSYSDARSIFDVVCVPYRGIYVMQTSLHLIFIVGVE